MITTLTKETIVTSLDAGALVTVIDSSSAYVTTLANPGPQGPKGEPGDISQIHEAATNLSGHRAIRIAAGLAYYCDGTDSAHTGRCIGITQGAVSAGDDATVQTVGLMTEPSWTWTEGPVYVGANGVLTQSLAGLAFIQQVGLAVSATSIDINPQLPILIS